MPRSDRALASFHFLIEQKMRNHCFVGRDYANESLQNCIFSVFDDLYSLEPQQEDYRKLNSKKYRPMAARKESRNVLSGRR